MNRLDYPKIVNHIKARMLKPPRLEGVVHKLGIKNKKKVKKSGKL